MNNGIDKNGYFNLTAQPHIKPISDLGIGFYNLDENTAKLRFNLFNVTGPLQLSDDNMTAFAYFESTNGSASDVIELEVIDKFKGIVGLTLDSEFLKACTSTTVTGQVYIGVNNIDRKKENNETAVFGEFEFEVADALINKISSFEKVEHIRMFTDLKREIEKRVYDIEEAIKNGEDYVTKVKNAAEEATNNIINFTSNMQNSVSNISENAKKDIRKLHDQTQSEINTLTKNARSNLEESSETTINRVTSKGEETNSYIDNKLSEFNDIIENHGFIKPTDLDDLSWQKYKMTENDGSRIRIDNFSENYNDVTELPSGYFDITIPEDNENVNAPADSNGNKTGYLAAVNVYVYNDRKQIFLMEYYTGDLYLKSVHRGIDRGWQAITKKVSDTGWIPFQLINGAKSNTEYKSENENGFDCAYRIFEQNGVVTKKIRVNGSKISHNQTIAQLPSNLCKNAQAFPVRVPVNFSGGYIVVRPNGAMNFYICGDRSDWNDTDYIYGEFTFND